MRTWVAAAAVAAVLAGSAFGLPNIDPSAGPFYDGVTYYLSTQRLAAVEARTSAWNTASTDSQTGTNRVALVEAHTSRWNTAVTDARAATTRCAIIEAFTNNIVSGNIVNGTILTDDIKDDEISSDDIETGAVETSDILNKTIIDEDVSDAAAIAGSKLNLNGTCGPIVSTNSIRATTGWGGAPVPASAGGTVTETVHGGDGNVYYQFTVTFTTNVTIVDPAGDYGAGWKLYDCPEGAFQLVGAVVTGITVTAGAGGIADDADLDVSFGTTANADADVHSPTTDDDIVLNFAALLAAGTKYTTAVNVTPAGFDGSGTAKDLYVNVFIPNAGMSSDDTLEIRGGLKLTVLYAGDR